jgi:hypothetical protein
MDFTPAVIDPTLAAGVRAPAIANPLDQQAKAQGIATQQQQMQQSAAASAQALQGGAQDIQAKQIQMDQNKAINDAYAAAYKIDPTTGQGSLDTEGLSKALAQGGHGAAIPAIIEATTKAHKAVADLAETQGKVLDQQNDAAGSLGAAVRAANYDPHLFLTALQNAIDQKAVNSGALQPIVAHIQQLLQADPSGATAAPEVQAAVDHMIAQSPKQTGLDTAAATAAARKLTAQTGADTEAIKQPGEQAAADQAVLVNAAQKLHAATDQASYATILGGLPPKIAVQFPPSFDADTPAAIDRAAMTPEQRAAAQRDQNRLAEEAKRDGANAANQVAERKQADTRNQIEQGNLNVRQREFNATWGNSLDANGQVKKGADGNPLTGDAFLATLPQGRAAQIKSFAEGRETNIPRGNAGLGFMDQVNQYDPGFSVQRAQTRKDFSSAGASGKNIQALNTAAVHLDQLGEAAKALGNGTLVPGNAAFNALTSAFGGSAPTNFDGLKAAVASEMASALKGNATDSEIETIGKTISNASSPKQLAGIVDTNLHTLSAKLNTKDEQYQQGTDSTNPGYTPLGPAAKGVFDKHGIQPIQRLAKQQPAQGAPRAAQGGYLVGRKYGNLTYLGGDPKDRASWQ